MAQSRHHGRTSPFLVVNPVRFEGDRQIGPRTDQYADASGVIFIEGCAVFGAR